MAIQLIVGLGNPGKEYAATRHNAGAWWLQALCEQYNLSLSIQTKLQVSIGQAEINGIKFRCAIPTTFMNHSGQAVAKIANYFAIPANDILVVHDELDFPAGIIRVKTGGGHGGHNGLRDIIPQLNAQNFHRLRIGIGHPGDRDQVADYVLGNPSKADKQLIDAAIQESLRLLPSILAGEWQTVMNQLHQTPGN
jgi:PTH1 family peptidyl-tRNA hydrolase